MLTSATCVMDPALFESIPHDTNAVEAYHRFSKGKAMEPLQVALMTVYKEDKLAALQYLASCKGISTTYNDKTPAGRKKRADKANASRSRKRAREAGYEDGPPDKSSQWVNTPRRKKSKLTQKVRFVW